MRIKRGILCRNKGMIFQKVALEGAQPDSVVTAQASTINAPDTPCKIYPFGDDAYVLCLPDFAIDQHVVVTATAPDGKESLASLTINAKKAKLESKANYATKKAEAYEIRDYDEHFLDCVADIWVTDCLAGRTRTVIRGKVFLPDVGAREIVMRLLADDGTQIGDAFNADHYTMDEYIEGDPNPYLEFPFSLEAPAEARTYFVVADVPACPATSNFCGLPADIFDGMRREFLEETLDACENPAYNDWFMRTRVNERDLVRQKAIDFPYAPKYSIIVPLYHTPLHLFREMADSVLAQSYANWELVLVNSTPENAELTELVAEYAARDGRVKVVELDGNYGITENTNRGVAQATGDFVAFFDHDDVLEPDILFEYTKALNEDPKADLLYCDEDKLFENGFYGGPNFKPDFSIDQLRNNNYLCHMLTVRKSVLDEIGPTPEGFDGSQDHWLTLRVSELTDNIRHVRKVLYHWRAIPGSTALSNSNKSYATEAGIKAVQSNLDRLGIDATVEGYGRPFTYRVHYHLPHSAKVSIVIPSHNCAAMLRKCVDSIVEKTQYENYELVLVENGSTEQALFDYYDELKASKLPVKVVKWKGEGFNFSSIVNYGVKKSKGELVLLLNNDIEVIDGDWLEILAGFAMRPDVGAVGPRLYFPDGTYQHAGLAVVGNGVARLFANIPEESGLSKYLTYNDMTRNVSAVTGACLMTRRDVFDQVGGFDEKLSVAFNDVDYCLKVADAGYLVVYTADTSLYHYESFTRGVDHDFSEKQVRLNEELARFKQRWARVYVDGDPYYNKNLASREPFVKYFGLNDFSLM